MIKKLLVVAWVVGLSNLALAQTNEATAQQDTTWWVGSKMSFLFNQVALTNWAAGGNNSLAWNATGEFNANYKKGKWAWDNYLFMGYGTSKQGDNPLNKTDDKILISTNVGYDISSSWYGIFNANIRTQFANGFTTDNDSTRSSTFMAPGYLVAGLGFEYKPSDNFFLKLMPVANKTTFVLDDSLSSVGAYGVDINKKSRQEFGAFLALNFKKELVKNVTFSTLYTMFGDYRDLAVWDVNWDLMLDLKVNEFLSANFTVNMIYDQDVEIPVDTTGDGVKDSTGPRVQFRQALGVGLTATLGTTK